MRSVQIVLLSLLVAWQGWLLSQTFGLEHNLRPVAPAIAWQASVSDPQPGTSPLRPAQLGAIVSAAVFSPTRRLAARPAPVVSRAPVKPVVINKPKPAPAPPAPELPVLLLEGVMLSLFQEMALVRVPDSEERKWLRLDEKFEGWTLIAITPTEILLESGKSQVKVPLYVDNR